MIIKGQVIRVFPKDTNTDEIIAGKYKYDELDTTKLAAHAFESIDPTFYEDSQKNKNLIIVADSNFGCGSSREQAPLVIKACKSQNAFQILIMLRNGEFQIISLIVMTVLICFLKM